MSGEFLLIYICNFHVLSHLLLIYICKLHWNHQDLIGEARTDAAMSFHTDVSAAEGMTSSYFPNTSIDLTVSHNSLFSIGNASLPIVEINEAMRTMTQCVGRDGSVISLSSSKVWTPHEVNLQRAVHR